MFKRLWFIGIGVFIICSFIVGIVFGLELQKDRISVLQKNNPTREENIPIIPHGIFEKELYDDFYKDIDIERNGAQSALVAHHLIVGKKIANIFETVGDEDVKQIILVSPNHFHRGIGSMITSNVSWSTPYGSVETDARIINDLLDTKSIVHDIRPFYEEHGVNALTPFIKRSFPKAKMIPIILDESATQESIERLAQRIQEIAPRALLIASIDMSHNLPLGVQQFHDTLTQMTLISGTLNHDLEIDSNASMRFLLEVNRLRGDQVWHETYHNSSLATGVAQAWIDNTSHILGYFTKGMPEEKIWSSFLFTGDIMLDRGTRKQIVNANDSAYPWKYMKRFLSGVDKRIANLEGTINEQPSSYTYDPPFRFVFDPSYIEAMKPYIDIVSLANNHSADVGASKGQAETRMWLDKIGISWFGAWETPEPVYDFDIRGRKYRLIGYHAFQPNEEKLMTLITEGDGQDRFVIVIPHWGVEYQHNPYYGQKESAKRMVDAGADLIVGMHPHVVQGIDVTNGVPVIYSLGNFIFDQRIPITWDAMTLGVIHTEKEIMLYFLPIGTKESQPVPYDGEDAMRVLQAVSKASPESLRKDILQSLLIIPYAK